MAGKNDAGTPVILVSKTMIPVYATLVEFAIFATLTDENKEVMKDKPYICKETKSQDYE